MSFKELIKNRRITDDRQGDFVGDARRPGLAADEACTKVAQIASQVTERPEWYDPFGKTVSFDSRKFSLAKRVRLRTWGMDVIYHGTPSPLAVLHSRMLLYGEVGDCVVNFTRSPEIAAYWALIPRDRDEPRSAVLALDRAAVRMRYRLEPHHDPLCELIGYNVDEMEERVWGQDVELIGCLADVIFE